MKKVTIQSINVNDYNYNGGEITRILIDDQEICFQTYGGEPEDNSRSRDYSWVEPLLAQLAQALGAEVKIEKVDFDNSEAFDKYLEKQ